MIFTIINSIKTIWNNIAPYVAGISIGGIISCVFYCLFKFGFNKALNKIDTTKMENKCINAAKQEVKETTFKVSIQPVVLSEVKKICEEIKEDANNKLIESNTAIYDRLTKLENVVIALGNYFDDSIGVSESKKEAFHNAVEELNTKTETEKEVVVEQLEVLPNVEVEKEEKTTIYR